VSKVGVVDCEGCGVVESGTFSSTEHHGFSFDAIQNSEELFLANLWWGKNYDPIERVGIFAIQKDISLSGTKTISFTYNVDSYNSSDVNDIHCVY